MNWYTVIRTAALTNLIVLVAFFAVILTTGLLAVARVSDSGNVLSVFLFAALVSLIWSVLALLVTGSLWLFAHFKAPANSPQQKKQVLLASIILSGALLVAFFVVLVLPHLP